MTRDKVEIHPRRAMTPARRQRVLARFNGTCARLDCEETGGLQIDHRIALALGGKDDDDNLEPLCPPHHLVKTKRDQALIAKAKRLAGETCTAPGKKIQSRGFPKGGPKQKIPSRPFAKRKKTP